MLKRLAASATPLSHTTIGVLMLGGLLFLRIPYLAGLTALVNPLPMWLSTFLFFSFTIATYLLTAALIWWERDRLQAFWFDLVSAIIFLCQEVMFLAGIGLFAAMRRRKARFPAPPPGLLRWTLIGALLAILSEILITQMNLNPPVQRTFQPATLGVLFAMVPAQITFAAILEEPLFRGFLWGYLRLARWKNVWIWLFQAGLFTLSHFYYLSDEPFVPWLIRLLIPSLLLGLIAWQARSIAASMVTHGFFNATSNLLQFPGTAAEAMQVAWMGAGLVAAALLVVLLVEIILQRKQSQRNLV